MNLQNELTKMVRKKSETEYTRLYEGTVLSASGSGIHRVRLKNGAVVTNVPGPSGLQVNDSVILATYSGQKKGFAIVSKGCKKVGAIKEIRVP